MSDVVKDPGFFTSRVPGLFFSSSSTFSICFMLSFFSLNLVFFSSGQTWNHRNEVIKEIVSSEISYISGLRIMIDVSLFSSHGFFSFYFSMSVCLSLLTFSSIPTNLLKASVLVFFLFFF